MGNSIVGNIFGNSLIHGNSLKVGDSKFDTSLDATVAHVHRLAARGSVLFHQAVLVNSLDIESIGIIMNNDMVNWYIYLVVVVTI